MRIELPEVNGHYEFDDKFLDDGEIVTDVFVIVRTQTIHDMGDDTHVHVSYGDTATLGFRSDVAMSMGTLRMIADDMDDARKGHQHD